jgi:hypothetical protein
MIKLLFDLIATVMLSATVNAQENFKVGVNNNGIFEITENIDPIISGWTNFINENNIDATLTTFEIKRAKYNDAEGGLYYYLLAMNKDKTVKVAKLLLYDDITSVFYFSIDSHTITCNGCTAGCTPEHIKRVGWVCSDSCGSCKKTETVTVP